ncbi:hypothetical protein Tco_0051886 [Tanacetum coccineum]
MFADDVDLQESSPPSNTTHNLVINPQQSSIQEKAKKLMAKAKQNKRKSIFKQAIEQKFKEYDHKLEALTSINIPEAIEEVVQANVLTEMKKQLPTHVPTAIAKFVMPHLTTPSPTPTDDMSKIDLKLKLPHDDQDPPNDHEGEKRKKKDVGEPSSRSSKKDKAPVDSVQEDIPTDQTQYQEEEFIQKLPSAGWFTKKSGSADVAKARKPNWFDMLLKSDIDQNEDHILRLSNVVMAMKLKELIKKDKLTIADLEGVGLEMLKKQYKNYIELEYHADQLKAALLTEAQWISGEGDVSKPRSFEQHMYHIEGIEVMISDRWSKKIHLYQIDAWNGVGTSHKYQSFIFNSSTANKGNVLRPQTSGNSFRPTNMPRPNNSGNRRTNGGPLLACEHDGKCGAQFCKCGVLGVLMHNFDQAFNSFDFEDKCGAQWDLRVVKLLGIGTQIDGLYYFDKGQDETGFENANDVQVCDSSKGQAYQRTIYIKRIPLNLCSDDQGLDHVNFFSKVRHENLEIPSDDNHINATPIGDGSNSSHSGNLTIDQNENDLEHSQCSNEVTNVNEMVATSEDQFINSKGESLLAIFFVNLGLTNGAEGDSLTVGLTIVADGLTNVAVDLRNGVVGLTNVEDVCDWLTLVLRG